MSRAQTHLRISALDLSVNHGAQSVVKDFSFEMRIGECIAVLGANGAGKSSLLTALSGEYSKARISLFNAALNRAAFMKGAVIMNGAPLLAMSPNQRARLRAVLPQHSTLTFNLVVEEVVQMGAYPFSEAKPEQVSQWIGASLLDADLAGLRCSKYSELSGGEQQRVQFARVLVQARAIAYFQGHAWIFLDEPTASLDPRHQQLLMAKIQSLVRTLNFGVMIIMHDLNLAAYWCDRVMLMKDGVLIADDCPAKGLTAENLSNCFDMPMQVMTHPINPNKLIVVADQ